jgi:hypothetical protein
VTFATIVATPVATEHFSLECGDRSPHSKIQSRTDTPACRTNWRHATAITGEEALWWLLKSCRGTAEKKKTGRNACPTFTTNPTFLKPWLSRRVQCTDSASLSPFLPGIQVDMKARVDHSPRSDLPCDTRSDNSCTHRSNRSLHKRLFGSIGIGSNAADGSSPVHVPRCRVSRCSQASRKGRVDRQLHLPARCFQGFVRS